MTVDMSRIERFKAMTQADPNNELGHFSLGRAYMDAGLFNEAVPSLERVLALNSKFSKAYALLGRAYAAIHHKERAVETLTRGYAVAHERGDLLPRNEIAQMLKELDALVPEIRTEELTPEAAAAGKILCKRCGQIQPKMPEPPFSGQQGRQIQEHICVICWREWIGQGTKVINELRLNLTEKQGQEMYDKYMLEFLNLV